MNKRVVIVGGGILGLSTAFHILRANPSLNLTLIEKEDALAKHQTGRNSGVIHSGLYYKPGSAKALNCLAGYRSIIDFCEENSIPFEITGKLVVATDRSELGRLDNLMLRGVANGLSSLRYLSFSEIKDFEPHCVGVKALHVPQTGIVNYVEVAKKLGELILYLGGEIIFNQEISDIKRLGGEILSIGESHTWSSDVVVVCAGLQSDRLALKTHKDLDLRILPFRGEYFEILNQAPKLVNNLIYPVPNPAFPFLGVHFTRRMDGIVECGPNAVFSLGRETYNNRKIDVKDIWDSITWPGAHKLARKYWRVGIAEYRRSLNKTVFVRELQKLIPEIKSEYLQPGQVGIRAQAADRTGNLLDDFEIRQDGNLIHVCNAPSPAATASMSIGDRICEAVIKLV